MERDMAILSLIAKGERPLNKYRIWLQFQSKELGTEPTILTAIDELEESGLITAAQTNEKARGGKPSKQYDLTLLGLRLLLGGIQSLETSKPELSRSAVPYLLKKYRAFVPEIFSLWDQYKIRNIEDLAETCLFDAADKWYDASEYVGHKQDLKRWQKEAREGSRAEPDLHYRFIESFFFSADILENEERSRWLKAMKADADLRKPYISYLENRKKEELAHIARLDTLMKSIES